MSVNIDWYACVIMCDMTDVHSCVVSPIYSCAIMCDMTEVHSCVTRLIFMRDHVCYDSHSFTCGITDMTDTRVGLFCGSLLWVSFVGLFCGSLLWVSFVGLFYHWYDGYSRAIMCDMTNKHIGLHTHFCRSSTSPHAHGWAVFSMCLLSVSFECVFIVCLYCVSLLCVLNPWWGFRFSYLHFFFFPVGFLCAAIAAPLHTRAGGLSFACVFGVCVLSCMRGLWGGYDW